MTPTRTAGLLAAGALLLAGCGGEASKGGYASGPNTQTKARSSPAAPSGGGGAQVTMTNITFKPETLTARVGQTVTWKNQDGVPHDVKATQGASFKSAILQPGQSYSYKLAKAANVVYVCTIHPTMKAQIRVLE
jgi:plastocyanin